MQQHVSRAHGTNSGEDGLCTHFERQILGAKLDSYAKISKDIEVIWLTVQCWDSTQFTPKLIVITEVNCPESLNRVNIMIIIQHLLQFNCLIHKFLSCSIQPLSILLLVLTTMIASSFIVFNILVIQFLHKMTNSLVIIDNQYFYSNYFSSKLHI